MNEKELTYSLLAMGVLFVLAGALMRTPGTELAGANSYDVLNQALSAGPVLSLSTDGRLLNSDEFLVTPYHKILAVVHASAGILGLRILHVILAVVMLSGLFAFGISFGLPRLQAALLVAIASLSPLRITSLQGLDGSVFALMLFLWGAVCLNRRHRLVQVAGVLLLLSLGTMGFWHALVGLTAASVFALRKTEKVFFSLCVGAMACLLLWHLFSTPTFFRPTFSVPLTDLGARYGFGLFEVLGAGIAFFLSWRNARILLYFLGALVVSLAVAPLLPYASLVIADGVRRFINSILQHEWSAPLLQRMMIVLVFCTLLFSFLSFGTALGRGFPLPEDHETAMLMTGELDRGINVLVMPSEEGSFFTHKTDTRNYLASEEEIDGLLSQRSLEHTLDFLESRGIASVIILDPQSSTYENLVFVLGNQDEFTQEFMSSSVGMWLVNSQRT